MKRRALWAEDFAHHSFEARGPRHRLGSERAGASTPGAWMAWESPHYLGVRSSRGASAADARQRPHSQSRRPPQRPFRSKAPLGLSGAQGPASPSSNVIPNVPLGAPGSPVLRSRRVATGSAKTPWRRSGARSQLPKLGVEGSNLFRRSSSPRWGELLSA